MTYSVLVCDDEVDLASEWVGQIQAMVPAGIYAIAAAPSNDDVGAAVRTLIRRRKAARDGTERPAEPCLFDTVDILIIDYDLLHIDDDNARYTGEGVARLARAFSECAAVVVLNQFPEAQFDLSLRGHLVSHADLNIDAALLGTPGLWLDPPWTGFRPWSWQILSGVVDRQKARINAVVAGFDKPIVEVLGMHPDDAYRLSDSAFGFIAPEAGDFEALTGKTFRSFLAGTSDGRDASALIDSDPQAAARFVAARISKWLEREVLGPQDVLVDIPHLLQRFPFLLTGDMGDPEAWNAAIHDEAGLRAVIPNDFWFGPKEWLSRPAIWWRRAEADADIRKRRLDFDFSRVPEIGFLEDISSFGSLTEAHEFRAGFHNAFDRRFVKQVDGVKYAPQRRFAFGA